MRVWKGEEMAQGSISEIRVLEEGIFEIGGEIWNAGRGLWETRGRRVFIGRGRWGWRKTKCEFDLTAESAGPHAVVIIQHLHFFYIWITFATLEKYKYCMLFLKVKSLSDRCAQCHSVVWTISWVSLIVLINLVFPFILFFTIL